MYGRKSFKQQQKNCKHWWILLEVQSKKKKKRLGEKEEKEGEGGRRGERRRTEERMQAKKNLPVVTVLFLKLNIPRLLPIRHFTTFSISSMTILSLNTPLSTFVNHSLIPDRHLLGMGKGKRSVRAEAYSPRTLSLAEKWRHTHVLSRYNSKHPKKNVLLTFRRSNIFINFL